MARDDLKAKVILTAQTSGAEKGIKRTETAFRRFSGWLGSKFVFTLSEVARAFTAITGSIRDSAALESQTGALKANLAAQGVALDEFLKHLDEVAQGQIARADLIRASSSALLLGIPADKIAELLEVAAASAIATGSTITKAFEDIAVGIGRASPMILDNLGIVVKLGPIYADAAAALGKTVEELTAAEMKTGLLNAVLEVGKERVELFAGAQSELSVILNQSGAAVNDVKAKFGEFFGLALTAGAAVAVEVTRVFMKMADAVLFLGKGISYVGSLIPGMGDSFDGVTDKISDWQGQLRAGDESLKKVADAAWQASAAQLYLATGLDIAGHGFEEEERRVEDAAAALGRHTQASDAATDATHNLTEATQGEADAVGEASAAFEAYRDSLSRQNDEQERGIGLAKRRAAAEKEAAQTNLQGSSGNLFPGLSGATYSATYFTPWAEMTDSQKARFLRLGGVPPSNSRGWTESQG